MPGAPTGDTGDGGVSATGARAPDTHRAGGGNGQGPAPRDAAPTERSGSFLWRWWILVLCCSLGGLIGGVGYVLYSRAQPDEYSAALLLRVGRPAAAADTYTDPAYADRIQRTVREVVADPGVSRDAASALGLDAQQTEELLRDASVSIVPETELLKVEVVAGDQDSADRRARAIVDVATGKVSALYGTSVVFAPISDVPKVTVVRTPIVIPVAEGLIMGFLLGVGLAGLLDLVGRSRSRSARSVQR